MKAYRTFRIGLAKIARSSVLESTAVKLASALGPRLLDGALNHQMLRENLWEPCQGLAPLR